MIHITLRKFLGKNTHHCWGVTMEKERRLITFKRQIKTDLIFFSRVSTMSLATASDQIFNKKSINPIFSISWKFKISKTYVKVCVTRVWCRVGTTQWNMCGLLWQLFNLMNFAYLVTSLICFAGLLPYKLTKILH